MEKYSRKNLKAIQDIVQKKTGIAMTEGRKPAGYKIRRMALLAGSLLCFVTLCAFAYAKFSDLNGDDAMFASVYQGDGRFEIVVINNSDRELKLQDKVKVMQWSTGKEVEGDNDKIRMEVLTIAPHSQGVVSIDISEGYNIGAMEENLPDGDGYYFVLTNNNFAFGQDWMCFFDFEIERTEDVEHRMAEVAEQRLREQEAAGQQYGTGSLVYTDWIWPTVSRDVSGFYGERENGTYSDHVNIAGTAGDEVYAVADGVVMETAFESTCGNFIVVDLGDGITVKYGHLKEIKVAVGDEIKQGQVLAAMGQTGMASGPNLFFAVTVGGENVNPLAEE
ncbi:MAG: M23 family metallopeptidase [Lachnospiraceae bacterium]|nr:M23 family metallopeptidase [Lachnospiraceae bacterium]